MDPGMVGLGHEPLDGAGLTRIVAAVGSSGSGAVVLFLGNVRDHHGGRDVEAITYTAYEAMARRRLEAIVSELSEPGLSVAIHHRLGRLVVGDTSVVIATASAHRQAAYQASRLALERLKAEVPIWKREHYVGGESSWREEESLLPPRA